MLNPPRTSPRAGIAALISLSWLLFAVPALDAQTPCGPTNPHDWCAHQDSSGVSDDAEPEELFGAALAFGDFNDDGFDDLAVGVPNEEEVGAVHVFPGSAAGLTLTGQLFFSQNNVGGADEGAETGDEFGFALATGDFNGDGFDDLAVGSPGEDLPELFSANCSLLVCNDAGGVHVIYGSATGLTLGSADFFGEAELDTSLIGRNEDARLGSALGAGRFSSNGDTFADLVVGAPEFDGTANQGEIGGLYLTFGASSGLTTGAPGFRYLPEDGACEGESGDRLGAAIAVGSFQGPVADRIAAGGSTCTVGGSSATGSVFYYRSNVTTPELQLAQTDYSTAGNGPDDHFGASLAAGDFNGDGFVDLAAAAPNKNHGSGNPNDSGRVYVAYSTASGPDPGTNPDLIGEDEWAGQSPAAGENFGTALAAGDVTGDSFADLLMSAPGEGAQGGFLFLKKGSAGGLTTVDNEVISQGFIGGVTEAGDRFGSVLALGDVDGDGILEVAIGVPSKDVGADADAGMVYVTRFFGPLLFADGFESGTTSAWAVVVP